MFLGVVLVSYNSVYFLPLFMIFVMAVTFSAAPGSP